MRTLIPLILTLSLLAAACGDDDAPVADAAGPTSTTPTSTTADASPTTSTTTTTTTEAPSPDDQAPEGTSLGNGAANVAEMQAFLGVAPEDDGPFHMVNLIRYREFAVYPDGRDSELTGREADSIYGQFMSDEKLPEIGAELVYLADVEGELIAGAEFDRVAVVRYPSRAAFAAMTEDPEFQAMTIHKQAGVADTVVMATTLIDTPAAPPVDPPFPATADDPPFAFMHVLDYRETAEYAEGDEDADPTRSGKDAVSLYSANAGNVAVPLGVRPLAWFDVDVVVIGPPDTWEEVRINWFPSHATFEALTSDPTWQAGAHHRTAGLEATYAIQTLPIIEALG